jgi:23S rRNA pseudouridine2605 synthase
VGRLDYDAEGAVLLTDDGELANRLAHPRYGHRRTYLVKVHGEPSPEQLARMVAGVRLEDGPASALEATVHEHAEKNVWIRVVVGEGRFHLVKRLCESVGLQVQRLFRPEFGGVTVAGLRAGHFRPLAAAEVRQMRKLVGLEGGEPEAQKALPRSLLPKAARRHGHGPPLPPGFVPAEDREAPPEPGERGDAAERGGPPERGERAPQGQRAGRGERAPQGQRAARGERGAHAAPRPETRGEGRGSRAPHGARPQQGGGAKPRPRPGPGSRRGAGGRRSR